ncbi:SUMF1/EgtB/PvdO family nonheme iron enzyme, partial [bacterium]|nr:SUMF1/EgtB/PvdO family nonheme iron enzyme [bacterium]
MSDDRFPCIDCGMACEIVRAGDVVRFVCPVDGLHHALTVLAPDETGTDGVGPSREGQTLGPCRIVRAIGWEGGLPLYEGLDAGLGLPRSVSVLTHDTAHAHRFAAVARMTATLRHHALATVTHLGREGDALFAVQSSFMGRPLDRVVAEDGPLSPRAAFRLARTLAEALAHLHATGIVHRNVGPKTVMLLPTGDCVLRNFAFAAGANLPAEEGVVGQGGYLAPEQALSEAIDPRSDLYALGALLFLMLTGRPPFPAAYATEAVRAQLDGPTPSLPPIAGDSAGIVPALVNALMSQEPEDRPPDAKTVAEAIRSVELSLPEEPAPQGSIPDPPAAAEPGENLLMGVDDEPGPAATRAVLDPEQAVPLGEPPLHAMPTLEIRPTPGLDQEDDDNDDEPIDIMPFGNGARAMADGPTTPVDMDMLDDVEVILDPSTKNTMSMKIGLLAGALCVAGAIWFFFLRTSDPPPQATPPRPKIATPLPKKEEKKEEKKEDPKVVEARLHQAKAKGALDELQLKAAKAKPGEAAELCEAFLEEYGDTESAALVEEMLEKAKTALREKTAQDGARAILAILRNGRLPLPERLAATDAFLARYKGTEAEAKMVKARAKLLTAAENAATLAWTRMQARQDKQLAKGIYGPAIQALESGAQAHAGTQAGRTMARRLEAIRTGVAAKLDAMKARAAQLALECHFDAAAEQFNDPLTVWQIPEAKAQAEQAREAICAARATTVAGYATLLERFDEFVAAGSFDAARQAALAAKDETNCKTLQRLLHDKAADADLLQRAFTRAVAGAKVIAAELAQKGGKVWVQQAGGMRMPGIIRNPTSEGLEVDLPNLKGQVGWDRIARSQLTIFAESAPGQATVDDLCGLALLALSGSNIKVACEMFGAVIEKNPAAADAVVDCLRRNASRPVYVPGGVFQAGKGRKPAALRGYFLGSLEVSNIEYALYCRITQTLPPPDWRDGGYPRGYDIRPVVGITQEEARAYAAWLGRRLPTALEWERAVRGTEGRIYPWGDVFDPHRTNTKPAKVTPKWRPLLADVTRRLMRSDTFPFIHLVGNA